jgi:hypothetical protein
MKDVIVFYGYKGVGKDTCFELFEKITDKSVVKLSFAQKLRDTVWYLFQSKIGERERVDGAIHKKEEPIEGWEIPQNVKDDCGFTEEFWTGRRLLQWFGTEVCRNIYENIWIDSLTDELEKRPEEVICITDCRFKNEYDSIVALREKGYNVHFVNVSRDMGDNEFSGHASEKDIEHFEADVKLDNNLSIEVLNDKVSSVLGNININIKGQ